MSRREQFEDDGRTIADMSGLESPGLFGRHPRSLQNGKKDMHHSISGSGSAEGAI